jgi:hypothetical protein
MSSAEGSHVRTLAVEVARPAFMENGPGCGLSLPESFAYYDQESSSWKTSATWLFEGLDAFSENWPRSGLMLNGRCYPRPRLARRTNGRGYSLWPTLLAGDPLCLVKFSVETLRKMPSRQVTTKRNGGAKLCEELAGDFDSYLDSNFGEWLMGFPIGWTDLEDSAMQLSPPLPNISDAD